MHEMNILGWHSVRPIIADDGAEQGYSVDLNLVRHMLQCVKSSIDKVVVRTVDTDVIMLLLAYRHVVGNFSSNVFTWFGIN